MSTTAWVVVAAVIIAAVAGGFMLWTRTRTQRLRRRFGPEYDRALEQHSNRRAAERELLARTELHRTLDIRPLDPEARELYRRQWTRLQERFVDEPGTAVEEADRLLTTVMSERGYPTSGYEERVATLSVEHARALDHYRSGHEIGVRAGRQEASTEDLRQAMVHYRALFEDLLAVPEEGTDGAPRAESDAAPDAGSQAGSTSDAAADSKVGSSSTEHAASRTEAKTAPDPEPAGAEHDARSRTDADPRADERPAPEPSVRASGPADAPETRPGRSDHSRS